MLGRAPVFPIVTTQAHDATPVAFATILSCHVARVETEVARLNARAKRLRAAPYHLHVSAPRIRERRRFGPNDGPDGRLFREEVVDVTLAGTPVRAAGWAFVAKIDFLTDGDSSHPASVVVSKAPGHESLVLERPDATRCDHCRTARRRAVCYVVQNDEGARKVIGSSCLMDFTGGVRNVEALVALGFVASQIFDGADDEDGGWGGGSRSRADGLVDYLAPVAGMIRCYGWRSRGEARNRGTDDATADLASGWFHTEEPEKRRKYWPELGASTTRTDRAVALRAIHWAAQVNPDNDYLENIVAIARTGYVLPKHTGLAASIVSAWLRHREQLVRTASRPRANPDATCGTVGKRETFAVQIAGIMDIPGDFGLVRKVSMIEQESGAMLIWWASGDVPEAIEDALKPIPAGQAAPVVMIVATPKKYAEYKGTKQTVVSRVAIHVPKPPKAKKARKAKTDKTDDEGTASAA